MKVPVDDGARQAGTVKVGASERSGSLQFEPMRRRHLPAVLRIEHKAHPKPWTLGVFNSELAQGKSRYYIVMRVGGKVAAYGGLMFAADEAHVTNIAVAPSMRRQGLGTRVLAHLAREAAARDCRAMTLEVRVRNLAAQEMYRKFGFVAAGVRRNYYPETQEDALVMWLYGLGTREVEDRLAELEGQY